ncbi:bifunctional DNA topoisomerase [Babesia duncani]|uniref:DNA topoisomerase 2 n=1 Tax=Babesia duncani TaxID=323732 RepID=A0AAD9PMS3_9APIC|nr:bifunctional DNA topoisomerase [Babesia duncani]
MSGVQVEIAMSWSAESYISNIKGYANNVGTIAGTHIDGLKSAITKSVNLCCRKQGYFKTKGSSINGEYIREGLTAIVSVKLVGAEFDGQTKSKLGNQVAKIVVEKIASSQLVEVLERHPQLLLAIYNKSQAAKKAFEAAKAAKELVRSKNSNMLITGLPAKLSDCSSHDPLESELFIVEGESAAGNAKQARNRQFQAVLPLRGKILNVEKITNDIKVMDNEEIRLLINSLGIKVNPTTWRQDNITQVEEFSDTEEDESGPLSLRYGKIILLTDADVDGAHLRILLLGLLFRLCPRLFANGHVYTACPPLYRISEIGKKWNAHKSKKPAYVYAWNDEQLERLGFGNNNAPDNIISAMSKNICIQRFKGLGEMMAQQLWDTTMDPQKRTLNRISVADAKRASDMLWLLMGGDIQSRKEFIFSNCNNFDIADLDF